MSISSLNNIAFNPYQLTPAVNSFAQEANLQPENQPAGEQNNFAIGDANAAQSFKQENNSQSNNQSASQQEQATNQTSKKDLERQEDEETKQVLEQLKARDREVRTHEQAHMAAAGPYAKGGINYEYESGPDGNKYAVGGHVDIDVSPISGDPAATIQKAQVVQKAALAPAEPSAQDRSVAAEAAKMEAQARSELLEKELEEKSDSADGKESSAVAGNESSKGNEAREANEIPANQIKPQEFLQPDRNDFEIRLSLQAS